MFPQFTAACLQLNSKRNISENIPEITKLLDEATSIDADFITLPECTGLLEPNKNALKEKAPTEEDHQVLALVQEKATKAKSWILIGSLAIKLSDGKIANRSYLVGPDGKINATYDKIHMFGLDIL